MDLSELQRTVDRWVQEHGGYWNEFEVLARLVEELGEVSSAFQRIKGLRPRTVDVDLASEVGDMLFTLSVFANLTGVDLDRTIRETLAKYSQRDGQAWKNNNQDR